MPIVARSTPSRAYFSARGPDVEPPEWANSTPSASNRRRWFAILAAELFVQKRAEWLAGLDAYGNPLAPVGIPRINRPSDWHGTPYRKGFGPPLLPFTARSKSRGFNLLRVRSNERQATVYWLNLKGSIGKGPHPPWARILWIHKNKAPVIRDVIGVSPTGVLEALTRSLQRFRQGLGPTNLRTPISSKRGSFREATKPASGGDPFSVRFRSGRRNPAANLVRSFFEWRVTPEERALAVIPRGARVDQGRPTTPAPTVEPIPIPIQIPIGFLLSSGKPQIYRLGDRWIVVDSPWGWEVLRDGETSLAPLDSYLPAGEWRLVPPEWDEVPERVYRVFRAVASGELEPA